MRKAKKYMAFGWRAITKITKIVWERNEEGLALSSIKKLWSNTVNTFMYYIWNFLEQYGVGTRIQIDQWKQIEFYKKPKYTVKLST